VVFFGALTTMFFVRAMRRSGNGNWIGYVLAGAAAIYSHMFGALVLVVHAASVLLFPRKDIPWRRLFLSALGVGIQLIPLAMFQPGESQIHWNPPLQAGDLYTVVLALAGDSRFVLLVYAVGSLATVVVAMRLRWKPSFNVWRVAVVVSWLVVPIAIGVLVSIVKTPVMLPRYYVICIVPFVLATAAGLGMIRRPLILGAVLLAAVLFSSNNLRRQYALSNEKEDWRNATAYVVGEGSGGDAVVFYAYMVRQPFEYYFDRMRMSRDTLHLLELASAPLGTVRGKLSDLPDPDRDLLSQLPDRHRRVWFVRAHELPRLGRDREGEMIQQLLLRSFRLVSDSTFVEVRVQRFETADSNAATVE